jgi:hypothetical protein
MGRSVDVELIRGGRVEMTSALIKEPESGPDDLAGMR